MSSVTQAKRKVKSSAVFKPQSAFRSYALVSTFFMVLIIAFWWFLQSYWQNTLQPRFFLAAETQAKVLAESQAKVLLETLSRNQPEHLRRALTETIQEMLIVEDPAIGERFIRRIELQIDYSTIPVNEGSLDIVRGQSNCDACFLAEVPLIDRNGLLLGLASFSISDGYFRVLSNEMQSKLFAESSITLALVVAVWIVMLLMFQRLHKAKQLVEVSDQAKTRFMANVTHELRTPLNAILGYTQLYKQDQTAMQQFGKGIDSIDQSANHLLTMINDILEFSRTNDDHIVLHPEEVHLPGFLKHLVEMAEVRARLKSLNFNYEVAEPLPALVMVDEKRLRQVLLNLLSNAVKFTEQGEVIFKVYAMPSKLNNHTILRFSIRDTGIGIDAKQLHAIFIPFHQIDNAITRAEGTGLGLSISQKLVKLMGAQLRVESKMNEGSHFWFDLDLPIVNKSVGPVQSDILAREQMILPEPEWLDQLREHAKRHNILGIRELVSLLETQGEYEAFLQEIKPFISAYRFKPLLDWLELRVGQVKERSE